MNWETTLFLLEVKNIKIGILKIICHFQYGGQRYNMYFEGSNDNIVIKISKNIVKTIFDTLNFLIFLTLGKNKVKLPM